MAETKFFLILVYIGTSFLLALFLPLKIDWFKTGYVWNQIFIYYQRVCEVMVSHTSKTGDWSKELNILFPLYKDEPCQLQYWQSQSLYRGNKLLNFLDQSLTGWLVSGQEKDEPKTDIHLFKQISRIFLIIPS